MKRPNSGESWGAGKTAMPEASLSAADDCCKSRTITHTLQLIAGPLHMTFTETADAVFFSISGALPKGCERQKIIRFMKPLIDAYRDDRRRMEMMSDRVARTGHIDPMPNGWWRAYETQDQANT